MPYRNSYICNAYKTHWMKENRGTLQEVFGYETALRIAVEQMSIKHLRQHILCCLISEIRQQGNAQITQLQFLPLKHVPCTQDRRLLDEQVSKRIGWRAAKF